MKISGAKVTAPLAVQDAVTRKYAGEAEEPQRRVAVAVRQYEGVNILVFTHSYVRKNPLQM